MKSIFFIICFYLFLPNQLFAQFKATIFIWERSVTGDDLFKIIKIDEYGTVVFNEEERGMINVTSITKGFEELIKEKKIIKSKANYDAPPEIIPPAEGTQDIYISMIDIEDYNTESDYTNNSKYLWHESHTIDEKNYEFYKYFIDADLSLIKELLN